MSRILCWFGWHRFSPYWCKAYNLRTGYLRYYYECRRCGKELGDVK